MEKADFSVYWCNHTVGGVCGSCGRYIGRCVGASDGIANVIESLLVTSGLPADVVTVPPLREQQ